MFSEVQPQTALGQVIRNRRKELNMSEGDLARKLKLTRAQVCQIELGKNLTLHTSRGERTLAKCARVLKLKKKDLKGLRVPLTTDKKTLLVSKTALGNLIIGARTKLKLSRAQFAKRARMTPSRLVSIEEGVNRWRPDRYELRNLAKAGQLTAKEVRQAAASQSTKTTNYAFSLRTRSNLEAVKRLLPGKNLRTRDVIEQSLAITRKVLENGNFDSPS